MEKSAKSLEEQRREKQRKLARWILNLNLRRKLVKISGRAKAAARDVAALKSSKVISKMAFNCGASRFTLLQREVVVQASPKLENFKAKNITMRLKSRCRRCRSTTCGGPRSRWVQYKHCTAHAHLFVVKEEDGERVFSSKTIFALGSSGERDY